MIFGIKGYSRMKAAEDSSYPADNITEKFVEIISNF